MPNTVTFEDMQCPTCCCGFNQTINQWSDPLTVCMALRIQGWIGGLLDHPVTLGGVGRVALLLPPSEGW